MDLDLGQGGITCPATIGAVPVDRPMDAEEGVPRRAMPLVYFARGTRRAGNNPDLYSTWWRGWRRCWTLGTRPTPPRESAGVVINTMGWVAGSTRPSTLSRRGWRASSSGPRVARPSVGGVLAALEAHGLKETTLVAYCADHGPSYLGKGHVYEAGVRVIAGDAMAKGFGGQGGVRVPHPVTLLDVAPTILAAAGVPSARCPAQNRRSRCSATALRRAGELCVAERPIFIEVRASRGLSVIGDRGSWWSE